MLKKNYKLNIVKDCIKMMIQLQNTVKIIFVNKFVIININKLIKLYAKKSANYHWRNQL